MWGQGPAQPKTIKKKKKKLLGLLDPDPLVRGTDPDPDPSIIMQK